MKRVRVVAAFSLLAVAALFTIASGSRSVSAAPQQPPPAPTTYSQAAQFSWNLFVQAMTPSSTGNHLTFENWTEQCDLNPNQVAGCGIVAPTAAARTGVRHAHGSPLARSQTFVKSHRLGAKSALLGTQSASTVGCAPMAQPNSPNTGPGGTPGMTFTGGPSNLIPYNKTTNTGPVFCEEVFTNPAETSFLQGANSKNLNLTTLNAQQQYGNITFPWNAVEIKVDWVPASDFTGTIPASSTKPVFSCGSPNSQVYTEMIQFEGLTPQCYALASVHINSKILPDWVWATFEPNFSTTNPNRCNPGLYNACYDPWGTTSSQPYQGAVQNGTYVAPSAMKQSPALGQLMSGAKLDSPFNNYFMTGVQTQFVDSFGSATLLGNSFTEYNAGVNFQQASCISCHNYAYYNGAGKPPSAPSGNPPQTGTAPQPGFGPATPASPTGALCSNSTPPYPTSNPPCVAGVTGPQYTTQDFSWIMGLMPTSNYVGPTATAGKTPGKTAPKPKK